MIDSLFIFLELYLLCDGFLNIKLIVCYFWGWNVVDWWMWGCYCFESLRGRNFSSAAECWDWSWGHIDSSFLLLWVCGVFFDWKWVGYSLNLNLIKHNNSIRLKKYWIQNIIVMSNWEDFTSYSWWLAIF